MARIKPQALLLQSKKKKGPTRISVTTIILCNLLVVLIVLCLFGSYRHWSRRTLDQGGAGLPNLEDNDAFSSSKKYESDSFSEPKKYDLPGFAMIKTPKGHITVELFKDGSPEIVDRFLDLCQKGFFKGMAFSHVIKNYVIHGGNSQGIGIAEEWISRGKAHSELTTSPKHEAFMLGTSKHKHDSKGFELFITTAPIPDLNDKILVFGRVIKGEDVVQEIEEVDTDEHYQPKSNVGIIDVTLKREI
ncbi:peptidyl-prolyl cis-trans isomerase CYP21-4 [Humulus lupulus]|uniref:peptidyl-prolyl cis-trans isomerase CYP21-4 n=1 Tax=Humulus lupulus TaxID=3486 RepID=UPI002B407E79|nr:peptidyl-prolyl cis-trans isomerase CYP21-4 [Humulus lupulus]XP_062108792.1 peptidyl-prolyl cis-trans isomerase CYP21-4 [Humulus lupulus]